MECEKCEDGIIDTIYGVMRCECQREMKIKKIFNLSTAPSQFYKYSKDLEDQKVKSSLGNNTSYQAIISNITSDPEKFKKLIERNLTIVLKGTTGSGKTQMSITIALEAIKHFDLYAKKIEMYRMHYLNVREISNWMFDNDKKKRIMNYIHKSNILIIDDLGSEQTENAFVLKCLDEALRNFEGVKIITSNLNVDIHNFYYEKDKRLADVLVNTTEENHKKYNTLFYYVNKKQSRRIQDVSDLDLI